ncbi:lymphocyte cytosolic protein 2-like [Neosynchiropus ocellatus]
MAAAVIPICGGQYLTDEGSIRKGWYESVQRTQEQHTCPVLSNKCEQSIEMVGGTSCFWEELQRNRKKKRNDKSSVSSQVDRRLGWVESTMCANRTPTRAEVAGWSPAQLANYLRTMSLTGCDAVVLKNGISGSRFVDLSENDLQKFPKLHAPLICKISAEISRKEERRRFFTKKTPAPKYPDPAENVVGWADDEFDDDANYSSDDNDYVDPNSSDDNDYVDPNSDDDDDSADRYEDPPRENLNHLQTSDGKMSDSRYIGRDHRPSARPPELLPRPMPSTLPKMSRRDHSPNIQGQLTERGHPPKPQIFRDKKPGRDSGSSPSPSLGASHRASEQRSSANRAPIEPPCPRPQPKPWTPSGRYEEDGRKMDDASKRRTFPLSPSRPMDHISHGNSLPTGVKPALPQPAPSQPPSRAPSHQDLDPRWYAGRVSRDLAEGCLRELNKDGSYLVRDSTKQLAGQPFTLMVLYHHKVYNIQIRVQGHMFQLGTGLKVQETFPTISDIIDHYSQTPLLLIDAKNRSANQQNQCVLSHPAGYHAANLMGRTHH